MGQDDRPPRVGGLRVLIAGGGVAGLEALLALRALAGELTRIEIVSPEPFFWYRPLAVAEPFEHVDAVRFEVSGVAEAADAVFTLDEIASVDTHARVARTRHGTDVEYDVLVLAHGALSRPWLPGALTFRGPADTDALEAVLREAEEGAARSIVFVGADGGAWPLPLYELALLTGRRLARRPAAEITLVTPEPTPLSLFGEAASDAVRALLDGCGVSVHANRRATAYDGAVLQFEPWGSVPADRVVVLPRLEGRRILGIPHDGDGFIPTDASGRVRGVASVFAAGDVTSFPVKQGGIAAQQADAAAETIAALAGARLAPRPFRPVLHGLLLTGGPPLFLRSDPSGRDTAVGEAPLWWPPHKISGRYLAPFLAGYKGMTMA